DGKTQAQQLLAIRWLGEHPDQVKKADGARAVLEQIADGKKAQDGTGFAKLYARQALARLDRKPVSVAAVAPAGSRREEALAWFPADANVVAGLELRSQQRTIGPADERIGQFLAAIMTGPGGAEDLYRTAEKLGNVRLDRLALALTVNDNGDQPQVIF